MNPLLICMTLLLCTTSAYAERIKDLADIEGVRSNALIGDRKSVV